MVSGSSPLRSLSRFCTSAKRRGPRNLPRYDPVVEGESQIIHLPNGESLYIQGCQFSWIRLVLLIMVSLVTFLLALWVIIRRPLRLARWLHSQTKLCQATHIILKVYRPGRKKNTVILKQIGRKGDHKWLTWRNFRFAWSHCSQEFKKVDYIDESNLSLSEIHDLVKNIDNIDYESRKEIYGSNKTAVSSYNWLVVLLKILFRPFRMFQLSAVILWFLQNYSVYTTIFTLVTLVEISYKVYMKLKQGNLLQEASFNEINQSRVTILVSSLSERFRVDWKDLVPGNIVELSEDESVFLCDAVLLSGQCLVKESGSQLVHKFQLPESSTEIFNVDKHRSHVIFRGSTIFLPNQKVIALVLRTGWATEYGTVLASKLTETAPVLSDSHRRLNRIYTVLLACGIGASLYATCARYSRQQPTTDWWQTTLSSLDLLTICLPPLFPAALALVDFISFYRLHRRGFCFSQPFNPSALIHRTAASDSVAFFQKALEKDAETVVLETIKFDESSAFDLSMASCHSLVLGAEEHEQVVGSSDEVRVFPSSLWKLSNNSHIRSVANSSESYRITRLYGRGCSSTSDCLTLVRVDPDSQPGNSWYFMKGSARLLLESLGGDAVDVLSSRLRNWNDPDKRVVLYAGRPLTLNEKTFFGKVINWNTALEAGSFRLLGAVVLCSKASTQVVDTVAELRAAGLRTLLISRGHCQDALYLAKSAGIISPKEPVGKIEIPISEGQAPPSLSVIDLPADSSEEFCSQNFPMRMCPHVILDGPTLDALVETFPEMMDQIIKRVTILCDANVAQIDLFIDKWTQMGRSLIMCRESSDCLVTSLTPSLTLSDRTDFNGFVADMRNISGMPELIRQCRSALVGSIGISQCLICYATAQLMTTILLFENNNAFPQVQYFYIDFCLVLLPTILFGLTRATRDPLSNQIPSRKWMDWRYVTSVMAQLMLIVASQWFAMLMAQNQPWFASSYQIPEAEVMASEENYAIYSLSLFQYLNLFFVFCPGPPYRLRIWTNFPLTITLAFMALASSVLVLDPPEQLQHWMELKVAPEFDFRLAIFSLAVIYFLLSSAIQYLIDYSIGRCSRSSFVGTDDAGSSEFGGSGSVALNVLYKPETLALAHSFSSTSNSQL